MKKSAWVLAASLLLGACSGVPVVYSSYNGNAFVSAPTSADDPRLLQPRFYMDEDQTPQWLKAAPLNNR